MTVVKTASAIPASLFPLFVFISIEHILYIAVASDIIAHNHGITFRAIVSDHRTET